MCCKIVSKFIYRSMFHESLSIEPEKTISRSICMRMTTNCFYELNSFVIIYVELVRPSVTKCKVHVIWQESVNEELNGMEWVANHHYHHSIE
ncbi:hypothetical protein BLOT_015326 [Blomia tropicalis]|nr:hypothetical protein BLOT_015326 [Blomia tropicalis]